EEGQTARVSSDAAAAVGLNPYKSQLELWMEKTGRDADLPKPDPKDTTEPVYWGTLLEPIVAESYTQKPAAKCARSTRCYSTRNSLSCWQTWTGRSSDRLWCRSWSARRPGSSGQGSGKTAFPSTFSSRCSTNCPWRTSRRLTWPY